MAKIEDHKYSIEEAFRECFYVVPDYQCEYVWTEKEVQQLLEDIDEQFDAGERREYFIGTVLVSPTQQKNHFEVIDGQQRLTTFFLLLCALRQRFIGEPQYPLFSGLLATSYTDGGGNLKTSLKLEPRPAGGTAKHRQKLGSPLRSKSATLEIRRAEDITAAFEKVKNQSDAIYVVVDPLIVSNQVRIITLALAARLPAMYGTRDYVAAGGLISYGANFPDLWRRTADLVDKILRGAKPADIPVEQPTKFHLAINLTTAKVLGLEVPPMLLARADEVIE